MASALPLCPKTNQPRARRVSIIVANFRAFTNGAPLVFCLALFLAFPSVAQDDFEAGLAAFNDGDHARAAAIFGEAAEEGRREAQYALGLLYLEGQGVEMDASKGVHWLRRAAALGHVGAPARLGELYRAGRGSFHDRVEAHAWFTVAEAQGHPAGAKGRKALEGDLTEAELDQARRRAAEWMAQHQDAVDSERRSRFAAEMKRLQEIVERER